MTTDTIMRLYDNAVERNEMYQRQLELNETRYSELQHRHTKALVEVENLKEELKKWKGRGEFYTYEGNSI